MNASISHHLSKTITTEQLLGMLTTYPTTQKDLYPRNRRKPESDAVIVDPSSSPLFVSTESLQKAPLGSVAPELGMRDSVTSLLSERKVATASAWRCYGYVVSCETATRIMRDGKPAKFFIMHLDYVTQSQPYGPSLNEWFTTFVRADGSIRYTVSDLCDALLDSIAENNSIPVVAVYRALPSASSDLSFLVGFVYQHDTNVTGSWRVSVPRSNPAVDAVLPFSMQLKSTRLDLVDSVEPHNTKITAQQINDWCRIVDDEQRHAFVAKMLKEQVDAEEDKFFASDDDETPAARRARLRSEREWL